MILYMILMTPYSYIIPHLLLQPLVENAIVHGIDHESLDKGILTIYAHHNKNSLIFKILDNGCGMTKEQCDNIITSESNRYGIRNVHQRIQLIYGLNMAPIFQHQRLGHLRNINDRKILKGLLNKAIIATPPELPGK